MTPKTLGLEMVPRFLQERLCHSWCSDVFVELLVLLWLCGQQPGYLPAISSLIPVSELKLVDGIFQQLLSTLSIH